MFHRGIETAIVYLEELAQEAVKTKPSPAIWRIRF